MKDNTMKMITINGKEYTCPYYDAVQRPAPEERASLLADIKEHGVSMPVIVSEEGEVIDGHTRGEIAGELGVEVPVDVRKFRGDEHKRDEAIRLNVHRRHLTREYRQELVARELKRNPKRSDRSIAALVGVDHKTVGAKRAELESTGEIPQLTETEGKDKKTRKKANTTKPTADVPDADNLLKAVPPQKPNPSRASEPPGIPDEQDTAKATDAGSAPLEPFPNASPVSASLVVTTTSDDRELLREHFRLLRKLRGQHKGACTLVSRHAYLDAFKDWASKFERAAIRAGLIERESGTTVTT